MLNVLNVVEIVAVVFFIILEVVAAVAGFYLSRTPSGRKTYYNFQNYREAAKNAYTAASQESGLTGEQRKQYALDWAQKQLNSHGYKNINVSWLDNEIERAYAELTTTFDTAYNWGLSHGDTSQKESTIDKEVDKEAVAKEEPKANDKAALGTTSAGVPKGNVNEKPSDVVNKIPKQ